MFKRDVDLSNSPEFLREKPTLYFIFFFFLCLAVQATVSKHSDFGDILEVSTSYNETQELEKYSDLEGFAIPLGLIS